MQVNIHDAKSQLSQLIQSALDGEDVVIANRGKPVVRLVPVAVDEPRTPADLVAFLRANPLPEHLQRTQEEIEAGIREQRYSWD